MVTDTRLGVVLDRQFDFQTHLQQIDTKCSQGLRAITLLGRSKWGPSLEDKRQVYNACVTPVALYGASVWQHPGAPKKKGMHDRQLRSLVAIQRRAGHSISGGFKVVSRDAFDAELHLLPITQRLRRNRLTALTRIAATPAYQRILRQRAFSQNQALHSALEVAKESSTYGLTSTPCGWRSQPHLSCPVVETTPCGDSKMENRSANTPRHPLYRLSCGAKSLH